MYALFSGAVKSAGQWATSMLYGDNSAAMEMVPYEPLEIGEAFAGVVPRPVPATGPNPAWDVDEDAPADEVVEEPVEPVEDPVVEAEPVEDAFGNPVEEPAMNFEPAGDAQVIRGGQASQPDGWEEEAEEAVGNVEDIDEAADMQELNEAAEEMGALEGPEQVVND